MKGTYLAGICEDMDLVFPSVLEWMRGDILVRTSCSDQVSEYTIHTTPQHEWCELQEELEQMP